MASARFLRTPVVVVLGCTGAGKSKLAIEIATKFNGEIISADSMQVYQGLDIVTNKVTKEEQTAIKHYMIDFIQPLKTNYNVVDFKAEAVPIITKLHSDCKVPVIVGGTNYYIESLLWNFLLDQNVKTKNSLAAEKETPAQDKLSPSIIPTSDLSTSELYKKLTEVDLESCQRIHPNDRRKILRALELYEKHGVAMSSLLKEQHEDEGEQAISGPLRYPSPCILWLQCDQEVLDARTDKRVDEMYENGLLSELSEFHREYNASRMNKECEADYTQGIFQSIGFKEFHEYLILAENERSSDLGQALLKASVSEMKLVTRRYARKQIKWIRNRFLKRQGTHIPSVYGVDSTCVDRWDENVRERAFQVVEAYLKNERSPIEPMLHEEKSNVKQYNRCELCDLVFITSDNYQAHMNGRKHKKMVERQFREAKRKQLLLKYPQEEHASHRKDSNPDSPDSKRKKVYTETKGS